MSGAGSATFYLADWGARKIYAYDFDRGSGSIAGRRVFAEFERADGTPDGLAIDAAGCVWGAMWDGWAVR